MDWFSWLSSSGGLDPALVYEYGLLLTHNELDEDDIPLFDHELLRSIGVSIAKHRLEILKIARKHRAVAGSPRPVARILSVARHTKKCIDKCIRILLGRDSSAIVVVPKAAGDTTGRWKGIALKRSWKLGMLKQGRLMLTDGSGARVAARSPTLENSTSDGGSPAGGGGGGEKIRWDSMFQDLKPT